jgi:hypothetical protein
MIFEIFRYREGLNFDEMSCMDIAEINTVMYIHLTYMHVWMELQTCSYIYTSLLFCFNIDLVIYKEISNHFLRL